jgi:hypothetical protein
MSCIRPRAPTRDTANGLPADSARITAATSTGLRAWRRAVSKTSAPQGPSGTVCEGSKRSATCAAAPAAPPGAPGAPGAGSGSGATSSSTTRSTRVSAMVKRPPDSRVSRAWSASTNS